MPRANSKKALSETDAPAMQSTEVTIVDPPVPAKGAKSSDKRKRNTGTIPKTVHSKATVNGSNRLESSSEPPTATAVGKQCSTKPTVNVAKSCGYGCGKPDNNAMVQCDQCDTWFHFLCADVTEGIAEKDWICDNCERANDTAGLDSRQAHARKKETQLLHNTAISTSSRRSYKLRMELDMRKLEEEHKLEEQFALRRLHIEETLAKKQLNSKFEKLLRAVDDDESDEIEVVGEVEGGHSRIDAWISSIEIPAYQRKCFEKQSKVPKERDEVPSDEEEHFQQRHSRLMSVPHAGTVTFEPRQGSTPNRNSRPNDIHRRNSGMDVGDTLILNRSQLAARQAVPRDLPEFNGNPEDWPLFLSTFNSSTEMCGFSNEENMLRLRKCLSGRALEAVRCRLLHASNVSGVLSTLKMLYGKPETIIHAITMKIRSLPPPDMNKLETLVNFALSVENLCATIDACDVEEFMYNASLRYELIEKLPSSLKMEWAKFARNMRVPKLSDFSTWLYSMAEDASVVLLSAPTQRKPRAGYINVHTDAPAYQERIGSTKGIETSYRKECVVCRGQCPSLAKCKRFCDLSYDSRWAAVKEGHFCKKCLRRHKGVCRQQNECGRDGCTYKHHPLLHNPQVRVWPSDRSNHGVPSASKPPAPQIERNCNIHQAETNEVLFRIVPVTLHGMNTEIHTFAFIDDGSELSLIEDSVANELNLQGPHKPLCLKWTGEIRRYEKASRKVDLGISGSGTAVHPLKGIHTVAELKLPTQTLLIDELKQKYPHLRDIPIESYRNAVPRVLLGLDHTSLGNTLKCREGAWRDPIAVKTRLGWTVYGNSSGNETGNHYMNHHSVQACKCNCEIDNDLHREMKAYFSLDSLGITNPPMRTLSLADQRAQDLLVQLTRPLANQYETGLLWKYEHVRLPESKSMALKRWNCLEQRLAKDPKLAKIMQEKIEQYLDKKYIRKLKPEELTVRHPREWYLPIFPVVNPNKPAKVRIVWDAAAKSHGVSLNSVLLKGPDQLTSLPAVLHKFREYRVGISADIREMFHQVLIREEDQHSQRFLWRADRSENEPSVYAMRVMTFGACCSPSSAQYIKNLNAMRFEKRHPAAVDVIIRKHYVDDMLTSVENDQEAIQLAREVKLIHMSAGFDLRNWISNSSNVQRAMCEGNVEEKSLDFGSPLATEKILGMYWRTSSDTFTFKLSPRHDPELLSGARPPSKREVLRTLMMIFDPLGLIAHVLMYLKVILQDIWRAGIDWDERIDGKILQKWLQWLNILPLVEKVEIPRCFRVKTSKDNANSVQLHTFVDASEHGFAAAVYLRFEETDVVECTLVGSKTRVAPLTYLSIPRAELQAGVIGVRLAISIIESLTIKIAKRFYWTDSRDLLCWLQSDHKRYTQYVGSRVGEILESTEISEWRWVPTKHNVADDGTKWHRKPDLSSNSRWFNGPQFLHRPSDDWPSLPVSIGTTNNELRPHLLLHFRVPKRIIEFDNFSSWTRLYRVTATVLRAADSLLKIKLYRKNRTVNRNKHNKLTNSHDMQSLQQSELIQAQYWLYKQAQLEAYPDEYSFLLEASQRGQTIQIYRSSSLYSLSPYLDEHGVMRASSRIGACFYADPQSKRPVILPPVHSITHLIVQYYHCNLFHRNHETAINRLNLRYRIPRLRQLYRKLRGNCQRCKIESATPNPPLMGDLPATRLAAFSRPFSYVGVDYFGPLLVSVGRRTEKRWGMLVTCLTTRAIHIELAHSLNADSCIMALRCFMARRGVPIEILSDNGTNFQGASKELETTLKNLDKNKLISAIISPHTAWKFIPPASPHMGGAWERLVQSIKKNLYEWKLPKLPCDEVLRNALTEIEHTVNSRPLTHLPLDDDTAAVLTPNHFLLGSSDGLKPLAEFDDSPLAVKRNWQLSQLLANVFWRRWLNHYLPVITRRTKWFKMAKPLAVGDIVIIVDPSFPRNSWPKGRIIAVSKSKDGQVRRATVQTSSGIYERPAVKLAVLDVGVGSSSDQE